MKLTLKKNLLTATMLIGLYGTAVSAQDVLIVDTWGGSFRDLIDEAIATEFTARTGAKVEYVTGGTIDRLTKARLDPTAASDITFTTSHVGWLYVNDGLFEELDMSRLPNAENLMEQAKISPYHIGAWGYGYTIVYRPDMLPEGITFESWEELWNPDLKGMLAAPDFDPSHIIAVSALLSGAGPESWQEGQDKLGLLKPNFGAFYSNDASSQQLIAAGETPVQVMLSMNAMHMISEGIPIVVANPREGMVLGVDTMAISAGSKNQDLAYEFINIALDPKVQARIAEIKHGSPVVEGAPVPKEIADSIAVMTTPEDWNNVINIDPKLRAEKTAEWRQYFTENIMN